MKVDQKEMSMELNQFMNLASFKGLGTHVYKKWIQYSKKNPKEIKLRKYLISNLWNIQEYKEALPLLPEITAQNLDAVLKMHCQFLLNLAISGSITHTRRFVPIALSYSVFLENTQKTALLDMIKKIVHFQDSKNLIYFYELHLSLMTEVSELLTKNHLMNEKWLQLSPEILEMVCLNSFKKMHQLLNLAHSQSEMYYTQHGHLLFLSKSGFPFEEYSVPRKLFSEKLNTMLDMDLFLNNPKKMLSIMKTHFKDISGNLDVQNYIAEKLFPFFESHLSSDLSPQKDDSIYCFLDFYLKFSDFTLDKNIQTHEFTQLCIFSCRILKCKYRGDRPGLDELDKIDLEFDTLSKDILLKRKLFIDHCIKELNREYFLSCFLEGNSSKLIEFVLKRNPDMNLICETIIKGVLDKNGFASTERIDFLLEVLPYFKDMKSYNKDLKKTKKHFERK